MAPFKVPAAAELIPVIVNGQELRLPKGKNLLQALLDAEHYVPHYCYHPSLSVAGNCRLCLIEIEGRPKPEVSCNMVVAPGPGNEPMKIKTEGPLVESCRKGMMEFLLVNHPLDCPICDRGGECMLQRYSMEYGWGTARTKDERRRFVKPQFDALIDIERNRCIMCTRCVRFCDEVAGEHVMGVFGHGNRNYIGTYGNGPVSSVFSGNVIDLCPVGCLTSKPFRFKARAWELRQIMTTTRVANGPVTAWTRGQKLYRVTPPVRKRHGLWTIDEDTTQFISNETRFGSMHANSEERIIEPRVRRGEGFVKASWDVALDVAAAALRDAKPDQVCILAGERSSNEEFFLLSRLARAVLKTNNIDWRSRFVGEAAAQAAGAALVAGDGDLDLLDQKAYAATLMINADLYGSAPEIGLRIREAARLGRTRLGILDSRVDKWFGELAAPVYLEQPEDLAPVVEKLAAAIAAGSVPEGFEPLVNLLKHEQGLIVLGLDAAGGALNPALVPAVLKLVKALGGRWQFLPVTSARNAKGAVGCGAQADRLPGGSLADARARERAQQIWAGAPLLNDARQIAALPAAPELLRRAAEGKIQTLVLHRADELVTHPQRELIEKALDNTPNIIVIDVFPSWITERANVILPGSMFYESDGSMTDIDGTLQRMSAGQKPPAGAQEEWRVIESLSERLGSAKRYRKAEDVFSDLVQAWDAPAGFRLADLLLEGPGPFAPQVHRQSIGARTRPPFKLNSAELEAAAAALAAREPSDPLAKPAGLALLWNRHAQGLDHIGSRSTVFDALRPTPKVELNPADAATAGLKDGDWVLLEGGAARPSQVAVSLALAAGYAYGAANVLGLRLATDAGGFARIQLKKTDAPQPQEVIVEAGELLEV